MGMRKPRLRMEALVDLSSDELSGIAGGHTVDTTCCTCQTSINSRCDGGCGLVKITAADAIEWNTIIKG